jgi:hypothetical protein
LTATVVFVHFHCCIQSGIHLSPDWKQLIVILQEKFSKNWIFLTLLEGHPRTAIGVKGEAAKGHAPALFTFAASPSE